MEDKILTSRNRELVHKHHEKEMGELLEVAKVLGEQFAEQLLTPGEFEVKGRPTRCYNCHAFAFANRHGWVINPEVAIADDFIGVVDGPREDDVVLYLKDALLTHSAVVSEVGPDGAVVKVRSKWGECGELIHRLEEVPPVYGIPAVYLRRVRPVTTPNTKCLETETPTEGEEDEVTVTGPSVASLEATAGELGTSLMLASSGDVQDRIIRERAGLRPSGSPSAGELLLFATEPPVEGATESAGGEDDERDAITEQLTELLKPEVHLQLLFASTTGVARRIIAELPPVKRLTEMTKVSDPAPVHAAIGAAALRFFQNHGAQNDDKLSSILFFLLRNSPVRAAAQPLADYLLNRKPVGLARTLAVEAFAAAVVS